MALETSRSFSKEKGRIFCRAFGPRKRNSCLGRDTESPVLFSDFIIDPEEGKKYTANLDLVVLLGSPDQFFFFPLLADLCFFSWQAPWPVPWRSHLFSRVCGQRGFGKLHQKLDSFSPSVIKNLPRNPTFSPAT